MTDEADKTYAVRITATALAAIREQMRYIAVEQQSPQNASVWLDGIWTAIDGLEFMPLRYGEADGYGGLPYVVRRVLVDNHLILFMVDEVHTTVYVAGIRHGARQPRVGDLSVDLPGDKTSR